MSIFFTGRKPGFYLDQRLNYEILAHYARDRRVLDCFTNQGAFALTCARAGAAEITGVEASADNIAAAKRNASRNQLNVQWLEQDAFQFFARAEKAEAQYDLIVLESAVVHQKKKRLKDALRGYRELHMRAFKLLSKDGLLATFSCSHHVSDEVFSQSIADALVDCAAFGQKVAAIRAGTRSSGPADNSRNGIFQRRSVGK